MAKQRAQKQSKPKQMLSKSTKPIDLKDLLPQPADFTMNDKTYVLRKISLDDQVWLIDKFGEENLQSIFETLPLPELCQIIFHQLEVVDKSDFAYIEVEDYDDDGRKIKVELTGPQRIQRAVSGLEHQVELTKAVLKMIGISQPVLDALEAEEIKKNETA